MALVPHQYYINNGTFESVDGEIFYCMIGHFKPRRIFEIGSGNSTYLAAQAILKNKEEDSNKYELLAIDLYPNNLLMLRIKEKKDGPAVFGSGKKHERCNYE